MHPPASTLRRLEYGELQERSMTRQILVIDDETLVAEYLVTLLKRAGFAARSIQPGYGATRRIAEAHRQSPIGLLISDLFMPEPDGFEILQFARERLPGVPVIGMSGKHGMLLEAMRGLGACQVYRKPIDAAQLIAQARLLIEVTPHETDDIAGDAS
jgi:DNA-binding NtrC family response regulator